eukprot:4932655-Amphidinium_carterae.2
MIVRTVPDEEGPTRVQKTVEIVECIGLGELAKCCRVQGACHRADTRCTSGSVHERNQQAETFARCSHHGRWACAGACDLGKGI